jgi:hypothetical protein
MSSWLHKKEEEEEEEHPPAWKIPGSEDYLALRVTIISGKCAQRNEKKHENPDPYVLVTYGGQSFETKELKNNVKPKWDETFEIPIPPEDRNALGEVAIQMWDRNNKKKLKDQIFLGEIRLPVGDFGGVSYDYVQPRRYKLQARGDKYKKDKVDGEINIKVGMVLPQKPRGGRRSAASKLRLANGEETTEDLIEEAEEVVDESYEISKRSLQIAENTRQLAAETLETLAKQGDQLRRVQDDVDTIDELQDRADKHMRGINSIAGSLSNKFRWSSKRQDHVAKGDKLQDKQKTQREIYEEQQEEQAKRTAKTQATRRNFTRGSAPTGANDSDTFKEEFEVLSDESRQKIKETDRNLDRIGDLLDDMKLIALDMGDEIDDHNRRLEILNQDVNKANYRMKATNRKIKSNLA